MFRRCTHIDTRCIHGGEINTTIKFWSGRVARVRCLLCKKPLYNVELPAICWYTNTPHKRGSDAVYF